MQKNASYSIMLTLMDNNHIRKVGGCMRKSYLIMWCLFLIISLGAFNEDILKLKAKNDLIVEILKNTSSDISELGVRTSFSTKGDGEKACVTILQNLNFIGNKKVDVLKNNNIYTLDFRTDEFSGYIQYVKYGEKGKITVDVIAHKPDLGLIELRNKVEKAVIGIGEEKKYFQYVKARTKLSDITYAKDEIVELLKRNGATNIETINLEKGSSTTALTGHYEQMKSGKAWIDFNCAVMSYESGNFIIIGTPIIMSSY
jgi:hypothetical protein